MNVRIVPRGWPNRTDTYTGIVFVYSDGEGLSLHEHGPHALPSHILPLAQVAEIQMDDEGAVS